MKRTICVLVSMAMVVLALAGCAPTTPTPTPTPAPTPGATSTPPATPTTPAAQPSVSPTAPLPAGKSVPINVYFSYKEKMQPVRRVVPAGTKAVLRAAMEALLAGPTKAEKAAGLSSQIPAGTKLVGVSITGNLATILLTTKFESGGGTLSMTNRLAQVVFTATQFHTIAGVDFRINNTPVTVFGGEGIVLDHPQSRADFEDSTPAILVDTPAWGGTLSEGSTISGTANVFEATFRVQLRDSFGTLLFDSTVHATSGTGTRGTWAAKATLNNTTATSGKLKVFEASPKDGKPVHVVVIPVVLKH